MVMLGSILGSLLVACAAAAPVHSPAAGRVMARKEHSRTVRVAPLVRVQAKIGKRGHEHIHEHIHSHDVIDAPVVAMPPWDPSHSDHWNMRNGRVPVIVARGEVRLLPPVTRADRSQPQLVAKTRKGNFDGKKQRVFGNVGGLVKRKTRKFAHACVVVVARLPLTRAAPSP